MIFPGIIRQLPMQALVSGAGLRTSPRKLALLLLIGLIAEAGAAEFAGGLYIKGKAEMAQLLLARAWTRTLEGEAAAKPWPWADVWPVAKVTAPRLKKSAIVLSGASGQAMAFGPGLMAGAPAPGEPGLAIIAAHRDTHFRFLKDVVAGDRIDVVNEMGKQTSFVVTGTKIVRADQSGLVFDGDEPRLALVTCWPFEATRRGDLRFVVFGDIENG